MFFLINQHDVLAPPNGGPVFTCSAPFFATQEPQDLELGEALVLIQGHARRIMRSKARVAVAGGSGEVARFF